MTKKINNCQKPTWVSVLFDRDTVQLINEVTKARGETRSSFVRRAVRMALGELSYLSDEEKKALGIKKTEESKEVISDGRKREQSCLQ